MAATVLEATGDYLIVERLVAMPVDLPDVAGYGPGWSNRLRLVHEVRETAQVLYDGLALEHDAGFLEWLGELVRPGQQITTRRTGRLQYVLRYWGKTVVVSGPWPLDGHRVAVPSPVHYGADPIPAVQLLENPRVRFTSPGGIEDPTAMAFYNAARGTLEPVATAHRAAVVERLHTLTAEPPRVRR